MDITKFKNASTRLEPLRKMLADVATCVEESIQADQQVRELRAQAEKLIEQVTALEGTRRDLADKEAQAQEAFKRSQTHRARAQEVAQEKYQAAVDALDMKYKAHQADFQALLQAAEQAHQARIDEMKRETAQAEADRAAILKSLQEAADRVRGSLGI